MGAVEVDVASQVPPSVRAAGGGGGTESVPGLVP